MQSKKTQHSTHIKITKQQQQLCNVKTIHNNWSSWSW